MICTMPPHMMSIRKEALMGAKKNYQKFDGDFIASAVKLVETGKSAAQVGRELAENDSGCRSGVFRTG